MAETKFPLEFFKFSMMHPPEKSENPHISRKLRFWNEQKILKQVRKLDKKGLKTWRFVLTYNFNPYIFGPNYINLAKSKS